MSSRPQDACTSQMTGRFPSPSPDTFCCLLVGRGRTGSRSSPVAGDCACQPAVIRQVRVQDHLENIAKVKPNQENLRTQVWHNLSDKTE